MKFTLPFSIAITGAALCVLGVKYLRQDLLLCGVAIWCVGCLWTAHAAIKTS